MSSADAAARSEEPPPLPAGFQRNILVLTTLMIAVMASVDMTIVSVALPYMAGNLGASPDEIDWVVTMFTCGQALVIGVTGHLSRLFGRKRLAIIVVIGFVASSIACGLSQSLAQIVFFRFVQGVFSGPLIPLSQSMLVDAFPPEERGKGLSIWAMGVLGGPAIGPMLGGWLAQNLDWRWNFWVNLPIGIVALLLILFVVRRVEPMRVRTDWLGLGLLTVWVVSLQILLDQGDDLDWFGSLEIQLLALAFVTFLLAFVLRSIAIGNANIMRLGLFSDSNFVACSLLVTVLGSLFLGVLVITPQFLIDFLRWEVVTAGLVLGGGGVLGIFAARLSGQMVGMFGIRMVAWAALLIMSAGWYLYSRLNGDASPFQAFVPVACIMFGLMLVFPQLAAQAFRNLRADERDEGAGLFNFMKTLGFSFGVTFVGTMIYRGTPANWNGYVGDIALTDPALESVLNGPALQGDLPLTAAILAAELDRQAGILAITQLGEVLAVLALCAMPLVLLLKRR